MLFFDQSLFGRAEALSGYNKQRQGSTAASLTQCGQAAWWSQVAGSGPWWCQWPASPRAFSVVGPSGKGWSRDARASGRLRLGCTPAPGPAPHSGAPGSLSDTRRSGACCRSHGSGRGAGSQLKREHRWRSTFQQVMLEHVPPSYEEAVAEMTFPDLNTGAHFKLIQSRGHQFHFSNLSVLFPSGESLEGLSCSISLESLTALFSLNVYDHLHEILIQFLSEVKLILWVPWLSLVPAAFPNGVIS